MNDNAKKTLPEIWESEIVPDLEQIRETTLEEYRSSLRIWERLMGNPTVDRINRDTVREFRDKLISTPFQRGKIRAGKRSHSTVNRIMRDIHVAMSPLWPADRTNPSGLGVIPFFKWPRSLQSQRNLPFVFTSSDLDRLYLSCDAARPGSKFSRKSAMHDPSAWRLALVLALNCGARTWDLFRFQVSKINLEEYDPYRFGSITFFARKTGKLHKFPLNECAQKHVRAAIASRRIDDDLLFSGFAKGTCFYHTWQRICGAAKVSGTFEAMRKTCVTRHNSIVWNAGFWLSGHISTGVFGYYDNPSDRIFSAVYDLVQPVEFVRGAAAI